MRCRAFISLLLLLGACVLPVSGAGQDCPARTVINNGVCIGARGEDCSPREATSRICFDPDPQYTDAAAKAQVRGTVRLAATIDTNGCAKDIKVLTALGYGLDESAVSALRVWRFRKPATPVAMNIEINFDPRFSSRSPMKSPL